MSEYNIAIASSRKDTNWRNTIITWDELKERCKPIRTSETLDEYREMSKSDRGEVKDVGGFVGGTLKSDGNRRNDNLLDRTLLTIDVDNATQLPEKPNPRFAMIVHSTHSHTEEAPRYRVIVPLSRPCSPLEYSAVAHRIAEGLGVEQVDMTSCEPVRLMYWASAPKDAPTYYHSQDGEPLNVDAILATYIDWTDPSEWATKDTRKAQDAGRQELDRMHKAHASGGQQEMPRSKQNLVGSWCRTYSVYDVLNDMVAGVYTPAGINRYTYSGGSTFGGAVVYDGGDFFYSYHSTDPIGGRLLNSWDLYRILVYGHLDADTEPRTRTDRLPSSRAMAEYAMTVPAVKADYMRMVGMLSDNDEEDGEPVAPEEDWRVQLEIDKNGAYSNTLNNFYLILKNDPLIIKGRVKYDEFKREKVVVGELTWEREETELWTDADTAQAALYIEKEYRLKNKDSLQMILDAVVREDAYRMNGVRDFIAREKWDGMPRVDELFIRYLGVPDTPFNRKITRKSIVACVARAFDPGCKFDQIIVLAGYQGLGKSTILRKLAGGGRYFMDSFSLDNKSNKMQESVVGSWIIEIPELEGFYKQDMNTIKSFVSKQWDEFRPAYGREKVLAKRTCVFFATTNDEEFLRDSTGNRRFWILQCGEPLSSVFDLTDHDVAQIWAEAKAMYDDGKTPLWLDRDESLELEEMQKRYDVDSDQLGALESFLEVLLPYDWDTFGMDERRAYFVAVKNGRTYTRSHELDIPSRGTEQRTEISAIEVVNEFLMMDNGKDNYKAKMATTLLKKLDGWEFTGKQLTRSGGYGRQKVYRRKK